MSTTDAFGRPSIRRLVRETVAVSVGRIYRVSPGRRLRRPSLRSSTAEDGLSGRDRRRVALAQLRGRWVRRQVEERYGCSWRGLSAWFWPLGIIMAGVREGGRVQAMEARVPGAARPVSAGLFTGIGGLEILARGRRVHRPVQRRPERRAGSAFAGGHRCDPGHRSVPWCTTTRAGDAQKEWIPAIAMLVLSVLYIVFIGAR